MALIIKQTATTAASTAAASTAATSNYKVLNLTETVDQSLTQMVFRPNPSLPCEP